MVLFKHWSNRQKYGTKRNMQYLSTFAVSLAAMTASVSFSWTVPVIPKLLNNETDIRVTETQIAWLASASPPGLAISSLITAYTCDRFGRRATLLGSVLPFAVGTIFIFIAKQAWMLCVARFLWGMGAGAVTPVSMIYVSEIASKEIRGSLGVVVRFMVAFGSLLVITVGSIASYKQLSYMLLALSICYFAACWVIPETPYYLLKEGKIYQAKKALKKLNGYKDKKILDEKATEMRTHVTEEMKNSGTVKELFTGRQYRKPLMITFVLRLTQIMAGTLAIQQYLGRILQETDSDISVSIGIITYGATRFITSFVASFLADKMGRRPLIIWSYVGVFLTLAFLGTVFFFHEVLDKTPNHFGYVTLCSILLFTIISTLGYDTMNFIIPAEIFPLNVKSMATTCLNLFGYSLIFVHIRGYQLLKDLCGMHGLFWFYACSALSGAIYTYFVLPETKGKGLREIQLELQGELYDEASEKLRKDIDNEVEEPSRYQEKGNARLGGGTAVPPNEKREDLESFKV